MTGDAPTPLDPTVLSPAGSEAHRIAGLWWLTPFSPLQAFLHITLPIIKPGIVGGAIFAFITSFDEFIITYFLAIYTKTLPIEIFSSLMFQVSPAIAAISVLMLALSAFLLVILIARGQVVGGGTVVK